MQSYKKYLTAVSTYAEKKIYRCVFLVYGHTNTKKWTLVSINKCPSKKQLIKVRKCIIPISFNSLHTFPKCECLFLTYSFSYFICPSFRMGKDHRQGLLSSADRHRPKALSSSSIVSLVRRLRLAVELHRPYL